MTKASRLLLLSPSFHGYWQSIESAFAQLGHDVATCRYDARDLVGKVRHKLGVELPQRLRMTGGGDGANEVTAVAIQALRAFRPDVVLAVKGDLLGPDFHAECARLGVRRLVWIYDELENTRFTPDLLRSFDGIASYSRRDQASLRADGFDCLYVPDAFDPDLPLALRVTSEIVHVGALYPARKDALEALVRAEVPVRSYGRDWSHHPVDVLRTWGAKRPEVPGGREMPRGEAQGLMGGAPACLNIHGRHDGFNMRTFEAAGAGGVQLIDRTDVEELYEPGREILPFTTHEELVDLARRCIAEPRWGDRLRERARRRTLASHTFVHRARELERLFG